MAVSAIEIFIARRYSVVHRTPPHKTAPITRLGSLFIAAANPARRLLNATIDAFCEATVTLNRSRQADADHDAFLASVERLAERGLQISATQGCPCRVRYQSILLDVRAAQAADELEDGLIVLALTITRRWSLALERALKMRRQRAGKRQVTR